MTKDDVICKYLDCSVSELKKERVLENKESEQLYEKVIKYGMNEKYLVLTNSEADEIASSKFLKHLHKVKTETIKKYVDINIGYAVISTIQSFGEDGVFTLKKLLGDNYDKLVRYVCSVNPNGRGEYINVNMGKEERIGDFFIYRIS